MSLGTGALKVSGEGPEVIQAVEMADSWQQKHWYPQEAKHCSQTHQQHHRKTGDSHRLEPRRVASLDYFE